MMHVVVDDGDAVQTPRPGPRQRRPRRCCAGRTPLHDRPRRDGPAGARAQAHGGDCLLPPRPAHRPWLRRHAHPGGSHSRPESAAPAASAATASDCGDVKVSGSSITARPRVASSESRYVSSCTRASSSRARLPRLDHTRRHARASDRPRSSSTSARSTRSGCPGGVTWSAKRGEEISVRGIGGLSTAVCVKRPGRFGPGPTLSARGRTVGTGPPSRPVRPPPSPPTRRAGSGRAPPGLRGWSPARPASFPARPHPRRPGRRAAPPRPAPHG